MEYSKKFHVAALPFVWVVWFITDYGRMNSIFQSLHLKPRIDKYSFNISNWRKIGVASIPLFIIPGFFLHFSLEPSYGYLRFEGNRKISLGR